MSERQNVTRWEDAREDHRQRYVWSDIQVPNSGLGLDAFCGVGYGSWYLSTPKARQVVGVDASEDAINTAQEHFTRPSRCSFIQASWPGINVGHRQWDFITCLESVEHVENGLGLLMDLAEGLKVGGVITFSTPNSHFLPKLDGTWPHHHKHYTHEEMVDIASMSAVTDEHSFKLELQAWAGQDVYELRPNGRVKGFLERPVIKTATPGQFTLVSAKRVR